MQTIETVTTSRIADLWERMLKKHPNVRSIERFKVSEDVERIVVKQDKAELPGAIKWE